MGLTHKPRLIFALPHFKKELTAVFRSGIGQQHTAVYIKDDGGKKVFLPLPFHAGRIASLVKLALLGSQPGQIHFGESCLVHAEYAVDLLGI